MEIDMKKRFLLILTGISIVITLVIGLQKSHADTYRELKECLRHDINTTKPCTWERLKSVLDCYAAWGDQKLAINIGIAPTSSGYSTITNTLLNIKDEPYLMVEGLSSINVDLDIFSSDTLTSIDLFLLNDTYNPNDPDLGLLVGNDTDGTDGWSVTFNPDLGGSDPWVGYLVAQANFVGHDIEKDGDVAAIYITRDATCPVPEPDIVILFGIGLISLAGFNRKKFKK